MRYKSPEFNNHTRLVELCKSGSSEELLKHIRDCGYDAEYLNKRHGVGISPGGCIYFAHPLSYACMGNNVEAARLLLDLGLEPDPDLKLGCFKTDPPRQYAIGKPQFMKMFGDEPPWWRKTAYANGKISGNWPLSTSSLYLPKPAILVWHVMRGLRPDKPDLFFHRDFAKFPVVMQNFICRVNGTREEYENCQNWLSEHGAGEDLLQIFRTAQTPCPDEKRVLLGKLLLSADLLDAGLIFSMVNDILGPHDLVSLIMEMQCQYDSREDKEYIKNAMELLLGAILYKCSK